MKKYILLLLIVGITQGFSKGFKSKRWIESHHIVIDRVLGLSWQDTRMVRLRKRNWYSAKAYCEKLGINDKSNWRLPTLYELLTIVDYKKRNPALNDIFAFIQADGYYWSSDTIIKNSKFAWYVSFKEGNTYGFNKSKKAYVRCVRDN